MSWLTNHLALKEQQSRRHAAAEPPPAFPSAALLAPGVFVAWAQARFTLDPTPVPLPGMPRVGHLVLGRLAKRYVHPAHMLAHPAATYGRDDFACLLYAGLHQLARQGHLRYLQLVTLARPLGWLRWAGAPYCAFDRYSRTHRCYHTWLADHTGLHRYADLPDAIARLGQGQAVRPVLTQYPFEL